MAYGTLPPAIITHPANRTVSPGQAATFTVVASGTPPFTYQWQRFQGANWTNVGSNAASYTLANPQPADNGARFRVNVANAIGNLFSNEAVLTVTTNQAPTAAITLPSGRTALRRRPDDRVCRHRHRHRGRPAAGQRLHLAGGLPSRHPLPPLPASDQRPHQRHAS